MAANTRIYTMPFNIVYSLYIQKAEKKGRTKEEVDQILFWLTGYDAPGLQQQLDRMERVLSEAQRAVEVEQLASSGQKAREAEEALDGPEGEELEKARRDTAEGATS